MKIIRVNTLLAYIDDIVIIVTSQNKIEENAKRLFKNSHNIEAKTKY